MSILKKYKTIHTTELADRYITGIQIESDFNEPRYFVVEVMKHEEGVMNYVDGKPGVGLGESLAKTIIDMRVQLLKSKYIAYSEGEQI